MSQPPRKPGRPPSASARRKALSAARAILMEQGFGRLTIEAVSKASGVGKPTIYRNWKTLQALTMDALIDSAPAADPDPSLPPRAALEAQLSRIIAAFATTRGRQITMALASADPDSEFTRAFRNRVILSARTAGRSLLEQAIAKDNLTPPANLDILLDMIYGPLFFRLLAGHAPLDADLAHHLTATAFAALRG